MTTPSTGATTALRIGDAERQRAAERLGDHLRAGRLATAEYDERLERAFAARTAADLSPLFADLPGGTPVADPAQAPAPLYRFRGPVGAPTDVRRRPFLPVSLILVLVVLAAVAWTVFLRFPPFFVFPLLWFGFARHRWSGPARRRYSDRSYGSGR
ncbi:MAG: DUF1707 domain-containing protein [bacterium]